MYKIIMLFFLFIFWAIPISAQNPDSIPFAPAVNYGTGEHPTSVFCKDLDGDGDLDLAVTSHYSHAISILKNNGDGTFADAVHYATGVHTYPSWIFCSDLDGDDDIDLSVSLVTDCIFILKNNGDGTFTDTASYGAGDVPARHFNADLDGDDDWDIVVPNIFEHTVSVLENNGDGTFAEAVFYGVGGQPSTVFCADLDGDGDVDIIVANSDNANVSILKNNGDGTFDGRTDYWVESGPFCLFCSDLDGDSDLDLAVANSYSSSISVLKNSGDGTFGNRVDFPLESNPYSPFCADLDGDGDLDLAVKCDNDSVSILRNNGDGAFGNPVKYGVGEEPSCVFCADLDGDSDLDLAVANMSTSWNSISILMNLTQTPGNSAPYPFPLLSPANNSMTTYEVYFDWAPAFDPNLSDQIRYELLISTSSQFPTESTIVHTNLVKTSHIVTLSEDTYYWKVKAEDNKGAETWSNQTYSFVAYPSVGYWKFNEGTGIITYDYSGYGNSGTLMNGPNWVKGIDGKALELDGINDYVDCGNDASLNLTGDLSITAWVKFNEIPGDQAMFLSKDEGGGWYYKWMFGYAQNYTPVYNTLLFCLWNHNGSGTWLTSQTWIPTADDWYHVAVVKSDNHYTFYIDGLDHGEDSTNYTLPLVNAPVEIGRAEGNFYFQGVIDEVKIFSHALSTDEIREEYENAISLVGYWKFDEGTGDTAYDATIYENHGILINGPIRADGKYGNGLELDGMDDYVDCGNDASLNLTGDLSITAWVKFNEIPSDQAMFFSKDEGYGDEYKWCFGYLENYAVYSNALGFHINGPDPYPEGGEWSVSSELIPSIGVWYHVAVVKSDNHYTFYLNGMNHGEDSTVYALPSVNYPVELGRAEGNFYFNGIIDEMKVYGRALYPEEIWEEFLNRGDANADGEITISDVVYIINYLFKNGSPPVPLDSGDANCDGNVDIIDAVYLVNYLFKGGPPPC